MKAIILTIMLYGCLYGLLFGGDTGQGAGIQVRPYSVRLNYDDYALNTYGKKISRGTTVGLLLTMENPDRVVSRQGMESQRYLGLSITHHLILKDSLVRNMGGILDFWQKDYYADQDRGTVYYFHFDKLPGQGAEWLRLSGEFPLYYWSENKMTEPQVISLEEGKGITAGIFDVKILDIKEKEEKKLGDNVDYKYKINMEYTWKDKQYQLARGGNIQFTDMDGNIIACRSGSSYSSPKDEGRIANHEYSLAEKPEKVKCSVIYQTLEEINVPVDVKFHLTNGPE